MPKRRETYYSMSTKAQRNLLALVGAMGFLAMLLGFVLGMILGGQAT